MRKSLIASILIFTLFSLILYSYHDYPPFSWLESGIQQVFSGPQAALYTWKINMLDRDRTDISQLKKEKREVLEKLSDYENLKKDNEALRGQFETSSEGVSSTRLLPAVVVGSMGRMEVPYRLIISAGRNQGVKKGMTVVFGKNLVGKIGGTSSSYSEVILPVADSFSALGKTIENNTIGIIKGKGDFTIFDQVVIADTIQDGELIVTKGELDKDGLGVYPGIIVGKISSINKVETKPFQSAKVIPLIEYYKLYKVFVIMPQK